MGYISVNEALLSKYCKDDKVCFWNSVALINPMGRDDLYIFDCSMYKLLREEYADHVDARLLLSFKSPITLSKIQFMGQLGYVRLVEDTICSKDEIEGYIKSVLRNLEELINQSREEVAKIKSRPFSRFSLFGRGEAATLRGIYYGLLLRESMVKDMVKAMGFEEGALRSIVKKGYVLYSFNSSKKEFYGLILDKKIKLKAHDRIIDVNLLFENIRKQL